MKKEEKKIKEAFAAYQSEKWDRQKRSADRNRFYEEQFESRDGLEEKIFGCIDRMKIPNPRKKARRIYLGILTACVAIFVVAVTVYQNSQKNVLLTKELESVYSQLSEEYQELVGAEPQLVWAETEQGSLYCYQIFTLPAHLEKELRKKAGGFVKRDMAVSESLLSHVGTTASYSCYVNEEFVDKEQWEIYGFQGRESNEYCIFKSSGTFLGKYYNTSGTVFSDPESATHLYVDFRTDRNSFAGSAESILRDIYGIRDENDVRNVTLERYQAKSRREPEKLQAVYTRSAAKKFFLEAVKGKILPVQLWAEQEIHQDYIGGIHCDYLSWQECVIRLPEKCYLLGIENKMHETWIMGLAQLDDRLVIFADVKKKEDTVGCIVLEKSAEKELLEAISKAEEK